MSRRLLAKRVILVGLLSGLLWGLSTVKATTRQGVNYEVTTREIPLFVKAIDFLDRHEQYQLLTQHITDGLSSDRDRVLAVFEWTRQHIRPMPRDFPVIDDHILHIIIRGYGLDDQIADVFTTLSTYAGLPAFWSTFRAPQAGRRGVVLSFARVDGRWRVFDVARGFIFRDLSGEFATPEDVVANPQLITAVAGDLRLDEFPYPQFFEALSSFEVPRTLRAELQQPWPRLRHELGRLVKGF